MALLVQIYLKMNLLERAFKQLQVRQVVVTKMVMLAGVVVVVMFMVTVVVVVEVLPHIVSLVMIKVC